MAAKKPGKYDHLLPKLPKTTGIDDSYQARVEVEKTKFRKCATCKDLSAELQASCIVCKGTGRRALVPDLLATLYAKQRAEKEIAELVLSQVNCELEALTQMLIASQENGEVGWGAYGAADNALRLTSGDGLRTQPEIYPVVFDKAAFRNWLIREGMNGSVDLMIDAAQLNSMLFQLGSNKLTSKLTLPPKELSDMVKDRLLRGMPEPDGVKVFVKTKIVFSEMKTETVDNSMEESSTF